MENDLHPIMTGTTASGAYMRVYEILPDIEKSIDLAEKSKASTISFFVDKISAVVKLFKRYKKSLERLTPGGSEFVDDPEYCFDYIRNRQESQHQTIIRLQKELNQLRKGKEL